MQRDRFPPSVAAHLRWYVYRLIDPRNGETFYVGKGSGDRIFRHAKEELEPTEDPEDFKIRRLRDIRTAGLEVGHVIHRHHIESEEVALQIEAALIDAYPGLTNKVGGHSSGDYGSRHVEQIVAEYTAEPFTVAEPLILISVGKTYPDEGLSVYDSVRAAWRINRKKAEVFASLVLAHRQGIVIGAFRPKHWLRATKESFPWLPHDYPNRCGFEGIDAEPEVANLYLKKRVPDEFRRKGAANPVRFIPSLSQ